MRTSMRVHTRMYVHASTQYHLHQPEDEQAMGLGSLRRFHSRITPRGSQERKKMCQGRSASDPMVGFRAVWAAAEKLCLQLWGLRSLRETEVRRSKYIPAKV